MSEVKKIEFFRADGTPVVYRPLSDRLPGFLEQYGPDKGYAVVIEAKDWLELRPELVALYQAAVAGGRKPQDVGLPALDPTPVVVFTATLVDKEGRVLASASARKLIQMYKDWEAGETAARQRMLAALGYGGDVLDADESTDQQSMGLLGQLPSVEPDGELPAIPLVTAASVAESQQPEVIGPAAAQPLEPVSTTAATVAVVEPIAAGAPAAVVAEGEQPGKTRTPKIDPNGPPSEATMAQIRHQASLRNASVPPLKTQAEARAYLASLMKQPL